jgi:hypothetical protein
MQLAPKKILPNTISARPGFERPHSVAVKDHIRPGHTRQENAELEFQKSMLHRNFPCNIAKRTAEVEPLCLLIHIFGTLITGLQ